MHLQEITTYSRQLFDQMGPKAIAHAAQKAADFETAGDAAQAETWRSIERVLLERRGPHQG